MRITWMKLNARKICVSTGWISRDAARVFAGEVFRREDARYQYNEQRMIAIGMLDAATVPVVHVESEKIIRIVSMRRADKHETKIYFDYITSI